MRPWLAWKSLRANQRVEATLKLSLAALVAFSGIGGGLACGVYVALHDKKPQAEELLHPPMTPPPESPTILELDWDEKNECWHEH